jgi:hypothetical protein
MEVRGQLHAPAASPLPQNLLARRLVELQSQSGLFDTEKSFSPIMNLSQTSQPNSILSVLSLLHIHVYIYI